MATNDIVVFELRANVVIKSFSSHSFTRLWTVFACSRWFTIQFPQNYINRQSMQTSIRNQHFTLGMVKLSKDTGHENIFVTIPSNISLAHQIVTFQADRLKKKQITFPPLNWMRHLFRKLWFQTLDVINYSVRILSTCYTFALRGVSVKTNECSFECYFTIQLSNLQGFCPFEFHVHSRKMILQLIISNQSKRQFISKEQASCRSNHIEMRMF